MNTDQPSADRLIDDFHQQGIEAKNDLIESLGPNNDLLPIVAGFVADATDNLHAVIFFADVMPEPNIPVPQQIAAIITAAIGSAPVPVRLTQLMCALEGYVRRLPNPPPPGWLTDYNHGDMEREFANRADTGISEALTSSLIRPVDGTLMIYSRVSLFHYGEGGALVWEETESFDPRPAGDSDNLGIAMLELFKEVGR